MIFFNNNMQHQVETPLANVDALKLFVQLDDYGKGLIETVWSYCSNEKKIMLLFLNKDFNALCIRLNSSPIFKTSIYLMGVSNCTNCFSWGISEKQQVQNLTNMLKYFPICHQLNLQFSEIFRKCGKSMSILYNNSNIQKYLKELAFSSYKEEGLIGIRSLESLKYLSLENSFQLPDSGLQNLEGLTSLRILIISNCPCITIEGLKYVAKLSHLNTLELSNSHYLLLDDKVFTVLSSLKRLYRLIIEGGNGFGLIDSGMQVLSSEFSFLRALEISCSKITDISLTFISKGLPNLISLDITGCNKLTIENIRVLKKSRPMLHIYSGGSND